MAWGQALDHLWTISNLHRLLHLRSVTPYVVRTPSLRASVQLRWRIETGEGNLERHLLRPYCFHPQTAITARTRSFRAKVPKVFAATIKLVRVASTEKTGGWVDDRCERRMVERDYSLRRSWRCPQISRVALFPGSMRRNVTSLVSGIFTPLSIEKTML